jgi:hypothetical protein
MTPEFDKLTTFIRGYCEAYSLPDQSDDVLAHVQADMTQRPDRYSLHALSEMHATAARRVRELAGREEHWLGLFVAFLLAVGHAQGAGYAIAAWIGN